MQAIGQLLLDVIPFMGLEEMDQTVESGNGLAGMQGTEYQHPHFSRFYRRGCRITVSNFANQQYIGA
ncbi:MAG: hypothetical protein R2857_13770 [Vampirovibrionales bacterium]